MYKPFKNIDMNKAGKFGVRATEMKLIKLYSVKSTDANKSNVKKEKKSFLFPVV